MSTKIAAINDADVHRITSGQVIVDLTSAVKELLDNSIDSKADQFECVFKNYGMESLECSDNGSGVPENSYGSLALKHHTSKISSFEDVSQVRTLGFRGEALSSLATIANLVVITTTNPPKAARLEFNFKGELTKNTVTSRNKGTTVQVSQLFNNLPVRKKEFTRNHKRQFNKCIALLQQYTIIQDRMKISVWHITNNGRRTLVLSSTKDQGIPKRIIGVFGSAAMQGLSDIKLRLEINSNKSWASQVFEGEFKNPSEYIVEVSGYISKNSFGCGRNTKDRQFIFINRRPVLYPSLVKCSNEVYRSHNNVQFPVFFLNFEVAPEFLDINVTPDKRTVILHAENAVIDAFRDALADYYSDQEMVIPLSSSIRVKTDQQEPDFKRAKIEPMSQELDFQFQKDESGEPETPAEVVEETGPAEFVTDSTTDCVGIEEREPNIFVQDSEPSGEESGSDMPEIITVRTSESNPTAIGKLPPRGINSKQSKEMAHIPTQQKLDLFINPAQKKYPDLYVNDFDSVEEPLTLQIGDERIEEKARITRDNHLLFPEQTGKTSSHGSCNCSSAGDEGLSDDDLSEGVSGGTLRGQDPSSNTQKLADHQRSFNGQEHEKLPPIVELDADAPLLARAPSPRSSPKDCTHLLESDILCTTLQLSSDAIRQAFSDVSQVVERQSSRNHKNHIQKNEQLENFEEGERYLTLTVSKADFKKMEIVGQFNLGFILVTRRQGKKFDLFIVDQHASDEKFNFEMLQRTTVLKSQRLIAPQIVEMSVMDELIAMENLHVFEKNGFKLEVDENQPQGCRVKLVSLPVSKKTVFDMNDLHELIHFVKESDGLNKDALRCSKVRAMLAMRACRSSIMVGKPLVKKSMVRVIRNLSELDKPWNCPHGRPTMRHLMELRDWNVFDDDYVL
ncbi:LANO_0H08284g1_1 [Lachancea nothofagi CBS 11611]|uniref:LANO_0H08284g1_1 n=1 Tax=Lachancea nothofagi CBS 11611 TaxID=1266666 RepID=A0A1G4KLY1_9SACH|nr:LANO_0H08284g1_1 [Lachancea nothofagi CBS 11611]